PATRSSPSADGGDTSGSRGRRIPLYPVRAHTCPWADRHAPVARRYLRRAETKCISASASPCLTAPMDHAVIGKNRAGRVGFAILELFVERRKRLVRFVEQ